MTTRAESPEVINMSGPGSDENDPDGALDIDSKQEVDNDTTVETGVKNAHHSSSSSSSMSSLSSSDMAKRVNHGAGNGISGISNQQQQQQKEPGESPWMQNMFTKIYQDLRALSKDFHVPITVPELLFFGFQSSGKTSTLSILAKTPAGTMQDGTGTRCPVRYTLTYNEEFLQPKLQVSGVEVANFEEQTVAICNHMKSLESSSGAKFTGDILEVSIESCDVPNIIFVDMPGLIKKSNIAKYKDWKEQLEKITSELGTRRSADGESFAFIPVFVREAFDVENDDGYELATIDRLFRAKRPQWRDETLFIINKFDQKSNRPNATSFVDYIEQLCNEGETVITIANPGGERLQAMNPYQLTQHIKDVPNKEDRWWRELISDFRRKADPSAQALEEKKENFCGTKLMDQILIDKMCYIVKNTLPLLQSQLEKREQQYKDYLAKLQKDMDLDDPEKLKQRVQEFNHRFLECCKEFYQGRDLASVRAFRQTWKEDMAQFRSPKYFSTIHKTAQEWDSGSLNSDTPGFYIDVPILESELKHLGRIDLVNMSQASLLGGIAIQRALNLWIVMMSLMPFPDYTHEDILNFADPFSGTIQGDPWFMIRNVVYHASIGLRKGCIWFGEYLRYRLKANADIVFASCFAEQFGNAVQPFGKGHGSKYGNNVPLAMNKMGPRGHLQIAMNGTNRNVGARRQRRRVANKSGGGKSGRNKKSSSLDVALVSTKKNKSDANIAKLLNIGLSDYKKLVDIMVNEFQEAVEVIPADSAEILDRKFHEDIINLASLLEKLLEDDTNGGLIDREASSLDVYADGGKLAKDQSLLDSKQRAKLARHQRKAQETFESKSEKNQSKQQLVSSSRSKQVIGSVNNNNDNNNNNGGGDNADNKNNDANNDSVDPSQLLDDDDDGGWGDNDDADNVDDVKQNSGSAIDLDGAADRMKLREQYIELPYDQLHKSRDRPFYRELFPSKMKRQYHHMTDRDTQLIKKLARVVWTCIKKHVITTAQQTLTNRVLAELKQHGERCHDALLIGIDWPHIQDLIAELEKCTKIPKADIEKMIKKESKVPHQKGVGQMTNEDIRKAYGSNIEEIKQEYENMVNEYNAFLQKKEEVEEKIKQLQEMDLTEDID